MPKQKSDREQYLIRIGETLVPVNREIYGAYYGGERRERDLLLSAALHRLPGPDRTLIRQLYWDGLPRTGIARQEGVSEGAIRKREQRILKSLHSDLQEALSIPVQLPKRKCK